MVKFGEGDRRRLLESRHDIEALDDPTVLTLDEIFQQVLAHSRDRLSEKRVALMIAALFNVKEGTETTEARVDVDKSLVETVDRYDFVRSEVSHGLFRNDPDAPTSPDVLAKRETTFETIFNETPADLSELSPKRVVGRIEEVAKAMSDSKLIAPMNLHGRMERAGTDLGAKVEKWVREGGEDKDATIALRVARKAFDREHSGHKDQVRSVLRREDSKLPRGRYILSDEPAYRARRKAGQSIDEEPGIDIIDNEIDTSNEP